MIKFILPLVLLFSVSAQAFESKGECADKAVILAYEQMMADTFATTFQTIYTFKFDMKTKSSKLVDEGDINNGPLYSVVIQDNSNNSDVAYTVEFTSSGCHKKEVLPVLSGEE